MASPASRAGTGRRAARRSFPSRSIRCWWRRSSAALDPTATRAAKLAALLHDAPEYVIGDMISPFKAAIGGAYKEVERRLLAAIFIRFGLKPETEPALAKAIKAADGDAAFYEATALAGFSLAEARKFFARAAGCARRDFASYLAPWRPQEAQARFLARFAELDA